jgi:hypothetical protein
MGENTQPNVNKEPAQKAEGQAKTVEEAQVFCPVHLTDESREKLDEKGIENLKADAEQKLQELLRIVNEESTQLNRFLMDENKLVLEACMSLTLVLKKLAVSFNIPPQDLPFRRNVKKVILNEEGHLVLFYEKEEKHDAFLAEYPPEIVMAVLWVVMPELARAMTVYRKKVGTRANFFERVKKELKTVARAIENDEAKLGANKEQSNWC